jgi:8-oxo-dGTP diphosphatase
MKIVSSDELRHHRGISFVGVSTCFFCYDKNGRIFMAKRNANARDENGNWDIGAGGLELGLTAEDNMKKEIKEEYNAESLKTTFLGYRNVFRKLADGAKTHWLALDFAVLVDPKFVKVNEPHKFDDSGWFTMDSLPSPLHSQINSFMSVYDKQLRDLISSAQK